MIRSCMYLVICTKPDLAYPISYLSQFFAASSKSHYMAAKHLLQYITVTNNLQLSCLCCDALAITLEGYSDSDYRNYRDIQ
jgi:hypothetical protein